MKVLLNKGFDVMIFVHDVTNKILSSNSNYIVDVVMSPNSGNLRISVIKVIKTSILQRLAEKPYFCGVLLVQVNLGRALVVVFKFYNIVAKGLKLKVKMFLGVIPTFIEITVDKLAGGLFASHPE